MNLSMQEWFGIPAQSTLSRMERLRRKQEQDQELNPSGSPFAAAAAFTAIVPVIFALFWIISLIMSSISASKMNSMIADGSFAKLSVEERDFIPKIGSAASFTFWMPGVNIITSSVFAHRMRSL